MKALIAVVATSLMLQGCAPLISASMNLTVDEEAIKAKTAAHFGTTVKKIKITDIRKQALQTLYRTAYAGKQYNCYIYYGEVTCNQL